MIYGFHLFSNYHSVYLDSPPHIRGFVLSGHLCTGLKLASHTHKGFTGDVNSE